MQKLLCAISIFLFITGCASAPEMSDDNLNKTTKDKIAEINLQLAIAYLQKGDVQRAKQKLFYAMDLDPKLPEVWYTMGYFQESSGNKIEANTSYLKAIALAPTRGDVQNNYGTYLCRTGRYAESIQHFQLATQDSKYLDTASAYENAGLCASKIPDNKLAINFFSKALNNDPNRPVSESMLTKLRQTT